MTSSKLFEMRNLKIGLVCRFPLSKKFYSFQLAEGLRNLGAEVLLYGPKWGGLQTLKEDQRILKIWSPLTYIIDIPRRAIKDRVNIVHIQFEIPTFHLIGSLLLPLLLLILKVARKKVVITIHGPIFPREDSLKYLRFALPNFPFIRIAEFLLVGLYLLMDKLSDKIIVHAKVFKKWLTNFGLKKVYVIYHGIGEKEHESDHNRRRIILCLGTIAPRKGIDVFLRAIALVKDELKKKGLRVVIAGPHPSTLGNGRYFEKLLRLCRDLEEVIEMKGFLTDEILEDLLKETLVICLPYPTSVSASGILEIAIRWNISAIVSNTVYFREILGDDYPLFFNVNDPQSLATKICQVIKDELNLQRVYEIYSHLMRRFSWYNIAHHHISVYNEISKKVRP